jgi:hypothetical protein
MSHSLFSSAAAILLLASLAALPAADAAVPAGDAAVLYERLSPKPRMAAPHTAGRDLAAVRPSRNWAVDGNGFLRQLIKNKTGLVVYQGDTAEAKSASTLADVRILAQFKKTEDERRCRLGSRSACRIRAPTTSRVSPAASG